MTNGTSRPLGVFDSGVGGLTVLKALRAATPSRDFIYLADAARAPYGRKPREMVRDFASGIARFLVGLGVEGVIIACNTASAAALPELAWELPVPILGVIEPGVDAARRQTRTGRVGVIGTKGAIASGVYQRKIEALGFTVWARACPMFVHLVEEGLADSPEAELLAHQYLGDHPDIDTLILGCTHYPVLRRVIQCAMGDSVTLVSSADAMAGLVERTWDGSARSSGRVVHYVTGDVVSYRHTAQTIDALDGELIQLDVATLR
jgi:glutamate racemase